MESAIELETMLTAYPATVVLLLEHLVVVTESYVIGLPVVPIPLTILWTQFIFSTGVIDATT